MMFNATFKTIFQLYRGGQFYISCTYNMCFSFAFNIFNLKRNNCIFDHQFQAIKKKKIVTLIQK